MWIAFGCNCLPNMLILASYYMFYLTGNFSSGPQLSISLLHKIYQSHLLTWFHTTLQTVTGFIYPVVNPVTDTLQEQKFREYIFLIRTNFSFSCFPCHIIYNNFLLYGVIQIIQYPISYWLRSVWKHFITF